MSETNQSQPDPTNVRLEAYLDGQMTPAEREAFEVELATDDGLRREFELQRKIDLSLGRLFIEPAPPADLEAIAQPEATSKTLNQRAVRDQSKRDPNKLKKRLRAVVAVLAVCVAWFVVGKQVYRMFQDANDVPYRELALAEIYQESVEAGFRPKWVCEDNQEFAGTFQERQGLPLLLAPEAQDMMVGLSYLEGITPKTTTMLARVDDEPVLVFVDRLERDTQPNHPSWWSGLKLFRLELGELVLYEVTPLNEPHVIEHFYIPETTNGTIVQRDKKIREEKENSDNHK